MKGRVMFLVSFLLPLGSNLGLEQWGRRSRRRFQIGLLPGCSPRFERRWRKRRIRRKRHELERMRSSCFCWLAGLGQRFLWPDPGLGERMGGRLLTDWGRRPPFFVRSPSCRNYQSSTREPGPRHTVTY